MVKEYYVQVEIQGIDYNDAENGIVVKGIAITDALNHTTAFVAHPKTKFVKLAHPFNNEKLELPEDTGDLNIKLKGAILGLIGQINMPYIRRVRI